MANWKINLITNKVWKTQIESQQNDKNEENSSEAISISFLFAIQTHKKTIKQSVECPTAINRLLVNNKSEKTRKIQSTRMGEWWKRLFALCAGGWESTLRDTLQYWPICTRVCIALCNPLSLIRAVLCALISFRALSSHPKRILKEFLQFLSIEVRFAFFWSFSDS